MEDKMKKFGMMTAIFLIGGELVWGESNTPAPSVTISPEQPDKRIIDIGTIQKNPSSVRNIDQVLFWRNLIFGDTHLKGTNVFFTPTASFFLKTEYLITRKSYNNHQGELGETIISALQKYYDSDHAQKQFKSRNSEYNPLLDETIETRNKLLSSNNAKLLEKYNKNIEHQKEIIERYNIESRKEELKNFVHPTLRAADFQILFSAMNAFHAAYTSKGNSNNKEKCKEKAIEFLQETKYVNLKENGEINEYVKVNHDITVADANKRLKAFKQAYVNAISDNLNGRDEQKEKSSGKILGIGLENDTRARVRKKINDNSRVDLLYPEDLYAGAVANGKRTECVNGLKKNKIPVSEFDKIFNMEIKGREPKNQKP